ncbi:MAG TPA: HAMP domain-containing sensor histidine kinase [Kofleriaceae bacterium]|nr:HAMP domain-containing sensor histidine kinase [Kofleriaceae bacterium]
MSETPRARGSQPDGGLDGDRISRLERRIRELEARARTAENERDELVRACNDARAAQATAQNAMRARDDILAGVAHDLRNPLGSIVMGASTLRQLGGHGDPRTERIESIAERIHRQAERMASQISDLADLVELEAGRLAIQRESCAPRVIVGAAGERVGQLALERGVAFEARAEADLPDVECDPERVVQVLSNLVTCAVKVTAHGGAIEVGARASDQRGVVFFVRDTSPVARRDEPAAHNGSAWRKAPPCVRPGIGFALARGVVDAHGGQLWTVSEPNVGSTVCFSLSP